jgi:threonyl-tRNA synthetase
MNKTINLTLPSGDVKQVAAGSSAFDFAVSISPSLAKKAIAAIVDGKEIDIYLPLTKDCRLEIITTNI